MYQRKSRRCCAWMLAVSICLRLCIFLGLDAKAAAFVAAAARSTEFARWMLFLETGRAAQPDVETEQQPQLWVLKVEQPAETQPEEQEDTSEKTEAPVIQAVPAGSELHPASADAISVSGGCTYSYDKAALLARPTAMDLSGDGPKVLIVHTHSSEAYTPEAGLEYQPKGTYRTLDPERSVIRVGDVLAETLEAEGISALHDRSFNDYPDYNTSYWTTLGKIEDWLAKYPSIQMVIDIHRDAVEDDAGHAVALSATAGGESCARLMLVVGTDQGGLEHPNWQENLANALKLQAVLEGKYPGLCRSLDLRTERFNQHVTPGSLLVEVGTNGNTLTQAVESARLLGGALAEMLQALSLHGGTLS